MERRQPDGIKEISPTLKAPFSFSHFRAIKESNLKVSFKQSINASPFTSNCAFLGLLFQLLDSDSLQQDQSNRKDTPEPQSQVRPCWGLPTAPKREVFSVQE